MTDWSGRNTANKVFNIFLIIILLLSVFSFGANFAYAQTTQDATLLFSSPSTQVKEGQRFTINVEVTSTKQSINAVSGVVNFPGDLVHAISLSEDNSIVKLWTQEPKLRSNNILFEGIILNPGFQGSGGNIFSITFEAEQTGTVNLTFNEGSVLANNGLGTNVLATLGSTDFNILPAPAYNLAQAQPPTIKQQVAMLPVITKYFPSVGPGESMYIGGKGTPFALTKLSFENLTVPTLGEKFVALFQNKKDTLGDVIVNNNKNGTFDYLSSPNLVAGAYNATPFLVDTSKNVETPGISVQLLVNDSPIVRYLVILLNVLGLLIPVVLFVVIIYFIPWYSFKKMRILKQKMLLEEEQVEVSEEELKKKSQNPSK
jgi:hypothetical protein